MQTTLTMIFLTLCLTHYGCSSTEFESGNGKIIEQKGSDSKGTQGDSDNSDGNDAGDDAGQESGDNSDTGVDGSEAEDGEDSDAGSDGSDSVGSDDGAEGDDSKGDDSVDFSDGKFNGFICPADMNEANGNWSGTWLGYGPEGVLSGTVKLTMKKRDKKSYDVKNYRIEGSYIGQSQSIQQVDNFDFILTCNDAQFPITQVTWVDGKPYYVILRFTKQTWKPATLGGLGLGGPVSNNPTPGGFGSWNIKKN